MKDDSGIFCASWPSGEWGRVVGLDGAVQRGPCLGLAAGGHGQNRRLMRGVRRAMEGRESGVMQRVNRFAECARRRPAENTLKNRRVPFFAEISAALFVPVRRPFFDAAHSCSDFGAK